MGWLALLLLGLAAFAGLWRLGLARPLWAFAGAALMLGAAGYAWQGTPLLAGRPTAAGTNGIETDPAIVELRGDLFGRFNQEAAVTTAGDALLRAGADEGAVRILLGAINRYPRDTAFWTALGTNLAAHDGNRVSPPALFAFRRAIRLAPDHPGPRFFLGLAYVRGGEFAKARAQWARALALSPQGVSYHDKIAIRLALLDRLLAAAR